MNKKLNIALILLIVGLISSMGAANACPLTEVYYLNSHDVTVKQGKTATIEASLYVQFYLRDWRPPYELKKLGSAHACYNALLIFTLKDQEGHLLATKKAKMGDWWNPWPSATCKFKTANMPKGNHILTITHFNPKNGIDKLIEGNYQFNVI